MLIHSKIAIMWSHAKNRPSIDHAKANHRPSNDHAKAKHKQWYHVNRVKNILIKHIAKLRISSLTRNQKVSINQFKQLSSIGQKLPSYKKTKFSNQNNKDNQNTGNILNTCDYKDFEFHSRSKIGHILKLKSH